MVRAGVIGYGYWGPNVVRCLAETPGCEVVAIGDLIEERLSLARRRYPGVRTTTDWRELVADPRIDAVAIATPVSTHFELAMAALAAGKHVLVEKPLAATVAHARRLVEESERRRLVLMVDHTFVFTGAVRKIRELVSDPAFGDLYYYDSVRVNLGLFQHEVNVIWDLAVHDLSIMDYALPGRPVAVAAFGMSHVLDQPENIAYLTVFFPTKVIAHVHVNWLAPVKVRQTMICGSRQMIVYDDGEPSEKVKVYDRGITVNGTESPEDLYRLLVGYRIGDMWAPRLDTTEALRIEAAHFVECVERGTRPVTDGPAGLRVVEMLDAASRSLANGGRPVPLGAEGDRA
jgi:predicted dehydrogenase